MGTGLSPVRAKGGADIAAQSADKACNRKIAPIKKESEAIFASDSGFDDQRSAKNASATNLAVGKISLLASFFNALPVLPLCQHPGRRVCAVHLDRPLARLALLS